MLSMRTTRVAGPAVAACLAVTALAQSGPVEASRDFLRSPAGHAIFVPAPAVSTPIVAEPRAPETTEGNAPIDAIPGFADPGNVIRDGDLLYVGNFAEETTNTVSVVDIGTPGAESIVDTIDTPINPVDIAIVDGVLYVIDQNRDALHYRPLAGGEWSFIPIPNASITEWEYGSILWPHGNHIFITHFWENLISVVNLDTLTVELTITDLDHLPDRIEFTDEYFVVLAKGLDAPSCFANGPNFSLFRLSDYGKVYRRDVSGRCPLAMTLHGDDLYVAFNDDIDRYDLLSGDFVGSIGITDLGRHITHNDEVLLVQSGGYVATVDFALAAVDGIYSLLMTPQVWFPPLEEMLAMPAEDGRWFITNRNDDSVSIVRLALESVCNADLTGDGTVNLVDLTALLVAWGRCAGCPEDFDESGDVGFADLSTLLAQWGNCSSAP